MNNNIPLVDIKGSLDLHLDHYSIRLECKGQLLQLTFSSFAALRHFLIFNRKRRSLQLLPEMIEVNLQHFSIHYYLDSIFIGESHPSAAPNWLGRYLGMKSVSIFPKQILKYLFS